MLRSRLNRAALGTACALLAGACGGADGGEDAIRENVVEPGITAIDESGSAACDADAAALRTALEAYELLEGAPAPDEATLVADDFLREQTDSWDVVDGRIVAQDPSCGEPPDTTPAADIVTDVEPLGVDEMFATFTEQDIADVGGPECARELAVIFSGAARFVAETGREPADIADVDAEGFLDEPVSRWEVVGDTVRPADGSGCIDFVAAAGG